MNKVLHIFNVHYLINQQSYKLGYVYIYFTNEKTKNKRG